MILAIHLLNKPLVQIEIAALQRASNNIVTCFYLNTCE